METKEMFKLLAILILVEQVYHQLQDQLQGIVFSLKVT